MLNPNAQPFEIRKHPNHPPFSSYNKPLITPPFFNSPRFLDFPLVHPLHFPRKHHPKSLTGAFVWKNVSSVTFFRTRKPFRATPRGKNNPPCSANWIRGPKASAHYFFDKYPSPCQTQGKNKPPCSVNYMWRPKSESTARAPYDFDEYEAQLECKTSVMFKNIPNRFSKTVLLGYLDKHCAQENEKLKKTEDSVESAYDFLYLPMDFKTGLNLGYAFVNFTSVIAAVRFFRAYHDFKWGVVKRSSSKVCEIKYARIQGRENLEGHFRKSRFVCNTEEYLPTVFSPARNGANSTMTKASVIGTLSVSLRNTC